MLTIPGATATAAAVASSVSISAAALATTQWAISLTVTNLTCASGTPRARITVEDSVDAFTTPLTIGCFNLEGPILASAPVTVSIPRELCPSLRAGVTSAVLRFNLIALEGTSPTITYAGQLLP